MNTKQTITILPFTSYNLDIFVNHLKQAMNKGATDVEFDINYAPAGSRDEGPSLMIFTKSLTDEQIKQKKIAWHQEQIKVLEQE